MKRRWIALAGFLLLTCVAASLHAHDTFTLTGKIVQYDRPTLTSQNANEHGKLDIKCDGSFATITLQRESRHCRGTQAGSHRAHQRMG